MAYKRRKYNPNTDDPNIDELEGKANLEKNDLFALIIAATSVFLPIALLFIGIVLVIVLFLF